MADIPENILAFRTITTLISHIPRTTPIAPTDNFQQSNWQAAQTLAELRVSDSFAQLAVSEHDIVAVSTVRGWGLDLVAASDGEVTEAPAEPKSLPSKVAESLWQFFVTRNDRPRDPSTSSGGDYPIIIDSQKPLNLGDRTAYKYLQDLVTDWVQPSLPTHLWILTNVLMEGAKQRGQEGFRTELAGHLFKYTAAISYRKLKRRITNTHVSKPYIAALRKVGEMEIPSPPEYQNFGLPKENKPDVVLLKFIRDVQEDLHTKTPNLLALTTDIPSVSFPIYNNTTCAEVHGLLLELLSRYEQAVVDIDALSTGERPNNYASEFYRILVPLHTFGYGLLKLARSQTFQLHMEHIGPFLDRVQQYTIDPFQSGFPEGSQLEPEGEELEVEAELESVLSMNQDKEGTTKTPAKSYIDWLRLTVAHFDAVEIVMNYVMSDKFTHNEITVTNLVAPLSSKALYPWDKLLKDEKYFPTTDPLDPSSSTTNDDILKFLQEIMPKATTAKKLSSSAQAVSDAWKNGQPQVACKRINEIVKLGDEDVKEIAKSVRTQLNSWPESNVDEITKGIKDLHKRLHPLPPGNHFFSSLEKLEFRGALHCEICLASLVDMATKPGTSTSNYADVLSKLQPFGRVIGVSKRCCPVCIFFLKQLTKGRQDSFIVRGSHSVISACTLPPWTPSPVVDLMVQNFGAMLRRDLVTLLNSMATPSGFVRNRSDSTGSETLSVNSYDSYEEEVHKFGRIL